MDTGGCRRGVGKERAWKWVQYMDAEKLVNAIKNAPPGSLETIVILGHTSANGISFTDLHFGELADVNGEFFFYKGKQRWAVADLDLQGKGVKRIELRGCNTAGPSDRTREPLQQAKLREQGYRDHPEWFTGPTDNNFTNHFAQTVPGINVFGSVGLIWQTMPSSTPPGPVPTNLNPGRPPLNLLKGYRK